MDEFENEEIKKSGESEGLENQSEEGQNHVEGTAVPADTPKIDIKKEIIEWAQAIVIAVVIALVLRNFVFTLVKVEGPSMQPTLHNLDRLIVWRLGYVPKQGDIIIFHPHSEPKRAYVKRVIATEGQTVYVDYKKNTVYVDGKPLSEPYLDQPMLPRYSDQGTLTVPENCVFVLGDNRNNSTDSRSQSVGMVDRSTILGKAVFRIWPLNAIGVIK